MSLSVESYSDGEISLSRNRHSNIVTHRVGRGQRFLQKLVIDEEKLKRLASGGFLRDFISIAGTSSPTELELLILTAIHWIGEAQSEFDLDIAFVKYWIALECIFTREKDDEKGPTKALSEGIPKLSAYSHYKFIEVADIESISAKVLKLYDKRSNIIHRGMRHIEEEGQGVSPSDVSQVCKYTVWSIFSLFDLRCLNYATREQVIQRIEGPYPPSVSEDLQ